MNLNQVTLPSVDVAKSVSFYTRMGFELIVNSIPRYARFLCPDGQATFSVHLTTHASADTGVTVYFECTDLDSRYKQLVELGFQFPLSPTDQTWLWREARLRDPTGNELCLYSAGINRVNPPWRVQSGGETASPKI